MVVAPALVSVVAEIYGGSLLCLRRRWKQRDTIRYHQPCYCLVVQRLPWRWSDQGDLEPTLSQRSDPAQVRWCSGDRSSLNCHVIAGWGWLELRRSQAEAQMGMPTAPSNTTWHRETEMATRAFIILSRKGLKVLIFLQIVSTFSSIQSIYIYLVYQRQIILTIPFICGIAVR